MTASSVPPTPATVSRPYDVESVYALLPAYLRTRDEHLGTQLRAESSDLGALERPVGDYSPLRSLIALFASELRALHDGTEQMYDDLFIETCAEWVIPYIGKLVGVRLPPDALRDELNPRALVADAIADRRRKGTIGGLERVVDAAVASWVAKANEYWLLLSQSQNLNHVRPDNISINVRDAAGAEPINSPFDTSLHSVDSRSAGDGGRYNIPNVGIDIWRITSQRRRNSQAVRVAGRRFRFDPVGRDIALYTNPAPLVGNARVGTRNVAQPLTRWHLHRERGSIYPNDLEISVDGVAIAADRVVACNLQDAGAGWLNAGPNAFAADRPHDLLDSSITRVDPELGRFVLGTGLGPSGDVRVTYHYGDAAVIGGGSYSRDLTSILGERRLAAATRVGADGLASALNAQQAGVVVVEDSATADQVSVIVAPVDDTLTVVAEDGEQPVLRQGTLTLRVFPGATAVLDGFLIDADVEIVKPEAAPATVVLRDCTILPGGALRIAGPALTVVAERCVLPGMLVSRDTQVGLTDSVVDSGHPTAVAMIGGGALVAHESTLVGRLDVDRLDMVSNSLLVATRAAPGDVAPVRALRRQVGCVRFSWLPADAETPSTYRCVPTDGDDPAAPIFQSLRHGDAAYMQLDQRTADSIRRGSEQQSEMGVLHRFHQRAREIVLADQLDEFLRFGMEAGVRYAS